MRRYMKTLAIRLRTRDLNSILLVMQPAAGQGKLHCVCGRLLQSRARRREGAIVARLVVHVPRRHVSSNRTPLSISSYYHDAICGPAPVYTAVYTSVL